MKNVSIALTFYRRFIKMQKDLFLVQGVFVMIKKVIFSFLLITLTMFLSFSCSKRTHDVDAAIASLSTDELAHDIEILSSDEFEGRFPASPGEEKTIAFLKEEFENVGLKPGNGDSFFQDVPLVEITAIPQTNLDVTGGRESLAFAYEEDFVGVTLRVQEKVTVADSDMIFVGYGIIAPEYGWNDYEGIDVEGKTVVRHERIRRRTVMGGPGGGGAGMGQRDQVPRHASPLRKRLQTAGCAQLCRQIAGAPAHHGRGRKIQFCC